MLNPPQAISLASNKLAAFRKFKESGVAHPEWWEKPADVVRKGIILARTKITGSGGEGIVVCREGDALPAAPLYTQYIRKTAEYRLHVLGGRVLVVQQKRRDTEAEQTDDQKLIRNHANGWVFAVNDVVFSNEEQRKQCEQLAVASVAALGLDFGAVDMVVAAKTGTPYVLEVNTAPGIESPTLLAAYVQAFNQIRGSYPDDLQPAGKKEVVLPRAAGKPARRNRDNRRGV